MALLLCGALAFAGPVHARHDHAAHGASDGKETSVPSPRWATDPSLRDGMRRIHEALGELAHYEMGHMDGAMARERATTIQDAGAYIFTHCKLPPGQDGVLHGMLVPLMTSARKLEDQPDKAEVAVMRKAVADYPRYFDDPGWGVDTPPVHVDHEHQ
jgi:hypothetical protein